MKRTFYIFPKPNKELKRELKNILQSSSYNPRVRLRVAIVLRSSQGIPDMTIAQEFGNSKEMVKTWVTRFLERQEELNTYACENEPEDIRKEIVTTFSDRRRMGAPRKFDEDIIEQIKAIEQEKPRSYGIKAESWTYDTLAKVVTKEGIVPSISTSTISRIFDDSTELICPKEILDKILKK